MSDEQGGGLWGEIGTRELIHPSMTTGVCKEVVEAARQSTDTVSVRCPVRNCALDAQFQLNEGDRGKRMALYGSVPCWCAEARIYRATVQNGAIISNHVLFLLPIADHF